MSFKLWGRHSSVRTLKVIQALVELGIEYRLILASATTGPDGRVERGYQAYGVVNTPEYAAMNPNRRAPTIDDDGFVLWEANSIVEYLGMKYDPELFYGNDVYTFASASRWLGFEEHNLNARQREVAFQLLRYPEGNLDAEKLAAARRRLKEEFGKVENQLGKTDYIAADRWTMGDIAIGIRVHRWILLEGERPDMPNIMRYYDKIKARPAFMSVADPSYHTEG
ncbi:MAG: glutathione S-transferase family protein [Rhodospirillales bacterium]